MLQNEGMERESTSQFAHISSFKMKYPRRMGTKAIYRVFQKEICKLEGLCTFTQRTCALF
jgi:hypothetical protein